MVLEPTFDTNKNIDDFLVVHPLDDVPEQKIDTSHLGPMRMTRTVRYSLFALRAYLVLMMILVLYHVLTLAGFF